MLFFYVKRYRRVRQFYDIWVITASYGNAQRLRVATQFQNRAAGLMAYFNLLTYYLEHTTLLSKQQGWMNLTDRQHKRNRHNLNLITTA